MTFEKGQKPPAKAGRRKGIPNKMKLTRVAELLFDKNIHPVEEILKVLPSMKPSDQAKVWLQVLKYCEPQKSPSVLPDNFDARPANSVTISVIPDKVERVDNPLKDVGFNDSDDGGFE